LGPLAQSVEQRTFNPWVVGSSPTGPTHFVQMVSHLDRYIRNPLRPEKFRLTIFGSSSKEVQTCIGRQQHFGPTAPLGYLMRFEPGLTVSKWHI
jgi:hypothetical protein